MKKRVIGLGPITLLTILLLPTGSYACELHQGQSLLQNSIGDFHLPSVGDNEASITEAYGKPLRRMIGFNGLDVLDYGSFRVMVKDGRVTFAGMW